jgi:hypothetical protein
MPAKAAARFGVRAGTDIGVYRDPGYLLYMVEGSGKVLADTGPAPGLGPWLSRNEVEKIKAEWAKDLEILKNLEKQALAFAGRQGSSKTAAGLGAHWTKPWATVTSSEDVVLIQIFSKLDSTFFRFKELSKTYSRLGTLIEDIQFDIARLLGVPADRGEDILRPASTGNIAMGTTLIVGMEGEEADEEADAEFVKKVIDILAGHGLDVR